MKFLIGLILGIAIASGVILYINNKGTINQFVSPTISKTEIINHKLTASSPITLAPSINKLQQASQSLTQDIDNTQDNEESETIKSYDFYDVLDGKKSLNESNSINNQNNSIVKEEPKIYVQIGAYSNSDEANNMKARLILMDIEAKIINAKSKDGKMLNKVVIGPFNNANEAHKAQTTIQEQGISAIITKF